jgi:hypothetical protein
MFDGEEVRSSGTPSVWLLFDLLPTCKEDTLLTLWTLREPVQFLVNGAGLLRGLPTLVAAKRAPLSPPVYVLTCGFGFTGGLEKARVAPCRAASRTLYWVSPVLWLLA